MYLSLPDQAQLIRNVREEFAFRDTVGICESLGIRVDVDEYVALNIGIARSITVPDDIKVTIAKGKHDEVVGTKLKNWGFETENDVAFGFARHIEFILFGNPMGNKIGIEVYCFCVRLPTFTDPADYSTHPKHRFMYRTI